MRRIDFFEVAPHDRPAIQAFALPDTEIRLHPEPLTLETLSLATGAEIVSVFVFSRIGEAVLAQLNDLKLISTRSTGFDHVDLAACQARGVAVTYVPSYGENTVAEHAFALLLALAKRLPAATSRAASFSLPERPGIDLAGKVLGVLGAGRIGSFAIRIGRGFGMEVLVHDLRPDPARAEREGFRYVSLDDLLTASDVLSVHAALTPETWHLIDRAAFGRMKPGALLINTARGPIVDSEALLEALREGRLGGAGLDVLEGEELLRIDPRKASLAPEKLRQLAVCHALLQRDDVIVTPHMAFFTREGVDRLVSTSLMNIRAFLEGAPRNLVPGTSGAP